MVSNNQGNKKSSSLTGEEVVISGISGIFPSSNDVVEFMDNLYNKVDMVNKSKPRWVFKHPDLPNYVGTIHGMEKFDAQFFKVHYKHALFMEPMNRKLLEHVYGAIYDAGINPVSLKNTKVGIFIASTLTGSEFVVYETVQNAGLSLPGNLKALYANRVSYWLDSKGPSYTTDLGCASALVCLQHAYRSINAGECEAAIVGGANICNRPVLSINLKRSGLLCLDGKTKCFDKNGDGYVRSEAVNVFFLQKAKHAKRIHCEVYNVQGCYNMSPNDNFLPIREVGIIKKYLEDVHSNIGLDPNIVEYVECSGVGIAEADSNELEAIGQVYGRKTSIKVGSVKSNMGHSEAASGMCSLTKLCLAYHTGQLPANLHYNEPFDIPSVQGGSVHVLTDNADFSRGFTALNSFSFTGTTYHALLKGHYKEKNNDSYKSQIPYLLLMSGRRESWLNRMLNLLKWHPLDPEVIGLLHNIYRTDTPHHVYRGYAILDADYRGRVSSIAESVAYYNNTPGPVVFLYSGIGSSWPTLSSKLMKVPVFAQSMQKSHKILQSKGFNLLSLLSDANVTRDADFTDVMIGVTAMQIAFTDLLFEMGIVPDYIIGHSMGDIVCGYADGSLTAEQVLMSNYIRNKFWKDIPVTHGAMVAVGLGYQKLRRLCPPEIEVACHNSPKSSTISGPYAATRRFAEELEKSGIFVKELDCRNIPFHSTYVTHTESSLSNLLEEVIKHPKPRSSKWLSTSVPERSWNTPAAEFSSAEYHSRSLLAPVLFEEAAKHIPENAIMIEIAPHGQMKSILKQSHQESTYISLGKRGLDDPVKFLLEAVGRLYEVGLNPNVSLLYPAIEYPVSTTTPLLSHLIEWDHSQDWPTNEYKPKEIIISKSHNFTISVEDDDYKYIKGNIREGNNIFPEASLLILVWNTLAMYHRMDYKELSVVFDKVYFHDEVIIDVKNILRFYVVISKGNNTFEVTFENRLIVSGIVSINVDDIRAASTTVDINEDILLTKRDVYTLLYLRGYSYKGDFRSIESITIPSKNAKVAWIGEWALFLDSLIQLNILIREHNGISVLKYIHKIVIDVKENTTFMENVKNHIIFCNAYVNNNDGVTRCAGVIMETVVFLDKAILEDPRDLKCDINISYTGFPIHTNELKGKLFDYSGISKNQDRVMGVVHTTDENNSLMVDPDLIWPVPEYWSLEDAATVPVPYLYAFYCLTMKCNLRKHNSVLVTNGVKPLGQAVISLCLALECNVYATVKNEEDKIFIMKLFPNFQEDNIGNSQDGSFLDMIKCNTKGEGCDIVINTFKGILKQLVTRCLKKYGLLLVINNFDNTQDVDFEMSWLDFNRSYTIVDLPNVLISNNSEEKKILQRLVGEGITKGMVRPLTRLVYKPTEDSRTIQPRVSAENQRGRVLENMVVADNQINNIGEGIDFGATGNYVIICDESELGIELAEYLIKRGVKKIILNTLLNGFLQLKLRCWKKLNVCVEVCFENLVKTDACERLLQMRENGIIEGIFILNNCGSQNDIVNKTNNLNSDLERNTILHNLNVVSKSIGVDLKYYIIISYTSKDDVENNLISTCDMICEGRHKIGLPALHYLTGLVNTFDESNGIQSNVHLRKISNVFKDLEKSINSKEVKTNYLKMNDKSEDKFVNDVEQGLNNTIQIGFQTFYKYIEEEECTGTEILVNMTTKLRNANGNEQEFDPDETYLLMIPGFDGNCQVFKLLCERLKIPAIALQLTPDLNYYSMKTIASDIMKLLKKQIEVKSKFYILGYSLGVNVALELAALFEQEGHTGIVYCLDCSPDTLRILFHAYVGQLSDTELQDVFLNHMYFLFTKESKNINFENMEWSDKVKQVLDNIRFIPFSNEYKKLIIETMYKKIMLALSYEPNFKLESELILIKGIPHPKATDLVDDYNLSKYTKHPIKMFEINSDFSSVPEDCRIVDIVNKTLDPNLIEELNKRNLCDTYLL